MLENARRDFYDRWKNRDKTKPQSPGDNQLEGFVSGRGYTPGTSLERPDFSFVSGPSPRPYEKARLRDWKKRNGYPTTRYGRQLWKLNRMVERILEKFDG